MATLSTHIEADEANKWKAAKFPGFKLEDVPIAKVTGKTVEEKKISILLNGFDRRDKVGHVIETPMRQEKRTRVVTVNGKKEEHIYEIAVPVRTRRYDGTNLLSTKSRFGTFRVSPISLDANFETTILAETRPTPCR